MPSGSIAETNPAGAEAEFHAPDYDLATTLASGQSFRWRLISGAWEGVASRRWVRLQQAGSRIRARASGPADDWRWLRQYLQLEADLPAILSAFPPDPPLQAAVRACWGLRLLRQEPWECLASFILSSTKQIVQIQEMIRLLSRRYGDPIARAPAPAFAFPAPERLADATEADLRACKLGFRARYLRETARRVAAGEIELEPLRHETLDQARANLMALPGVGRKIADCVLLFAYGFNQAFPVDVWVMKALRQLYFPRKRMSLRKLQSFAETHFGPQAGYAQQYLFHYARLQKGKI